MPAQSFMILGAISGFFSVLLGAFAAHGLKTLLSPGMLAVFRTGVDYQIMHSLALLLTGLLLMNLQHRALTLAGWAFFIGILIFSGSLYLLALTDAGWLGAITPIGGSLFLLGWGALAWGLIKSQ